MAQAIVAAMLPKAKKWKPSIRSEGSDARASTSAVINAPASNHCRLRCPDNEIEAPRRERYDVDRSKPKRKPPARGSGGA